MILLYISIFRTGAPSPLAHPVSPQRTIEPAKGGTLLGTHHYMADTGSKNEVVRPPIWASVSKLQVAWTEHPSMETSLNSLLPLPPLKFTKIWGSLHWSKVVQKKKKNSAEALSSLSFSFLVPLFFCLMFWLTGPLLTKRNTLICLSNVLMTPEQVPTSD